MIDARTFADDFRKRFASEPTVVSAPGRVNLIGEHTDYNDGFVLPFAIDKRTFAGVALNDKGRVRAYTLTLDKAGEFGIDDSTPKRRDWTTYLRGVISVLREKGIAIKGADVLIDSDVPFGAGLSSSAALEISLGLALTTAAGVEIGRRELAFAGQRVEHEFAGVRSGIMDQFASALCEAGNALLLDCRSQETEQVPLNIEDAILVICDSRVKHSLASSEYNTRRQECEQGVEIISKTFEDIESLRDVDAARFEQVESELPENVRKRCRHVISENARTLAAVEALKQGDLVEVGRLMFASHASLRLDYEVSAPELDVLVDTAGRIQAAYGSRMTGGGFGGCTINLLAESVFEEFARTVAGEYKNAFGKEPWIAKVVASEGARVESL